VVVGTNYRETVVYAWAHLKDVPERKLERDLLERASQPESVIGSVLSDFVSVEACNITNNHKGGIYERSGCSYERFVRKT